MSGLLDDEDRYGSITWDIQQMPIDWRKLLEGGAFRVTQPGDGKGGFETNDNPQSWSLVTAYNDAQKDSITKQWPDKPAAYEDALRALETNQTGPLYDGKYRQMLWSAQEKNLSDYFKRPNGLLGGR